MSVHGLKYIELLNEFLASIVLILILDGFLIFEYTDLNIFITYEVVDMCTGRYFHFIRGSRCVDGCDLDSTL